LYGSDLSTYNFFGSLLFVPEVKNDAFHPVVLQGWTLTYEMFFYSVFAIGLLIVEKWRFWLLTIVFGLLFLLQPFIPAVHLRTLANPIIVEFLLGVALAQLWVSGRPIPLWAAALTLFVGLALFASVDDLVPSLPRLFRWGGPAVMVVGGSVFIERAWTMKRVSILGLLGDASYSIYLWHVVTAALIDGLLLKLKLPLMFHAVSVGALTLASTVTLYLLIEKPIIQFFAGTIDHPLQARSAKPAH